MVVKLYKQVVLFQNFHEMVIAHQHISPYSSPIISLQSSPTTVQIPFFAYWAPSDEYRIATNFHDTIFS